MPEIVVKLGNKVIDTHALFQEVIHVGRSRDNDVVVDHLSVSRRHCELRYEHGHWVVADLESANGTYVNGQRVTMVPLYHADTITVGKVHLHFFDTPVESEDQRIADFDGDRTMILSAPAVPKACLTIVKGKQRGKEHILAGEKTLIGRASDCQLQINDWRVAKYHAEVTQRGEGHVIEDLGTWGAILVNGKPVKEHILQEGDLIQLGGTRLVFRRVAAGVGVSDTGFPAAPEDEVPHGEMGYRMAVNAALDIPQRPAEKPPAETRPTEDLTGTEGRRKSPPAADVAEGHELLKQMGEMLEALDGSQWPARGGASASGDSEPSPEMRRDQEPPALDAAEPGGSDANGHSPANGASSPEVAMWMNALKSERPAIRRHAARQLERLTGRPYDA